MSSPQQSRLQDYPPVPLEKPKGTGWNLLMVIVPPVVFAGFLVLLYAFGRASLPEHRLFLMPDAWGLWNRAFALPEVRWELLDRALVTISIALAGLAISIPFGILLGIVMFRRLVFERALFPNIVAVNSIPSLAIIPLIQSALGFGMLPKVLIVAKFTLFAIPTNLLLGLKSMDRGIIDLFKLQGASWWTILWKAGFPSAGPALFAGLRIAASLAVVSAIVSELFFLAGRGGLGQMIMNTKTDFKYEQMYAALIVSTALSIGVYVFFTWLGNRLFSEWHESGGREN